MASPEDELLLAMWQGRGSWDGTAADAADLASYLEEADERTIPQAPAAIDRILTDLHHAGLVKPSAMPASMTRGIEIYRSYVLTDEGQARAHELEATDERFPPHSNDD